MSKYIVTGMTCSACQSHVEKAVSRVEGVDKVEVSLLTNSMTVEGEASTEAIIKAVEGAGYGAHLEGDKSSKQKEQSEVQRLLFRLIKSIVFLAILMYITMGHNMLGWPVPSFLEHKHVALALIQMVLSLIVLFINKAFFISGTKSVMRGAPNMDTLVALGSGISFLWSVFVLIKMTTMTTGVMEIYHNQLYFESAAMIPALITVGKTLEAYSKGRTTDALKSLMDMSPKTATIESDGVTQVVPVDQVKAGDIVVVKPGESYPVDGVIIEGVTTVNEAALTGESMPVDKTFGDEVNTATINMTGYVKVKTSKVGEDTAFAKIIKMVSDASSSKAPIARIADKVSGVFVPTVIAIAMVVFLGWLTLGHVGVAKALERGIAVLVISCPCALGLATPVAIMVGNGVGARNGILFKNGEALENTGRAKFVALDKTGTITEGNPQVTGLYPAQGVTDAELIGLAVDLESRSSHPLAKAITAHLEGVTPNEVRDYEELPGYGVKAIDKAGSVIKAGNASLIQNGLELEGTVVHFQRADKYYGAISLDDSIKEDSAKAVADLKKMGLIPIMITGDSHSAACRVAAKVGIDAIKSALTPEMKASALDSYKQKGKLIMVGDGINDAPALVSADIGIAIGAGTDVAIDSASVVLMNSRLSDVVNAIKLSKATLRNIHENLFWAFAYNVLLIPMAAGIIPGVSINPMWGAGAMALSSFCVCMNALRLNLIKLKDKPKEETKMEKTIVIEGMMCPMCEKHAREALAAISGVEVKTVSHVDKKAVVEVTGEVADEALKAAVNGAGYKAIEVK